ncbi:cytochrome c oxidase assembly protein CtaG/Cox11-domain-containing protein [Talaromyces proteolyticus]|uniref:Replication factor C subunit 5 n=1 Tax=Talaromyces proteolyticus TaxID=1131652 RepID=A0AAD4L4F8_9EURO|nr:cytochrome c oxidase assembly protein CtaG/Cox11-domain-containing protein [Talaromyces proteolyticus]KAH8705713.1 cytochrome c oxidase assembly protein CtaG/Cox11-domain-containing protein [Talaromyces proteolyticus]
MALPYARRLNPCHRHWIQQSLAKSTYNDLRFFSQHSNLRQQPSPYSNAESRKKNTSTLYYTLSVIMGTLALAYGSVPLYKMICQQIGWNGQPVQVHTIGSSDTTSRLQPVTDSRRLRITFNGSVSDVLPWKFTPQQREVRVLPGETALAFYTATNKGPADIIGVATYSVTPGQVAPYFSKIQCFCFEEQKLNAGESVDMPVFFFIDPDFAKDPSMRNIDTITLSYTFFKARYDDNDMPFDIISTMALLVDKLRPRTLDTLTYHPELSARLRSLAQSGDFPHLLVYGPSGAGKKTRIIATLKELYGPGVEKIKVDARVFQTTSNRKLEFNIVSSVYHLEITPSDVGNYDRVVVQELLKEVAQTQQVDQSAKQRFKVVVINEADHLTRDAQAALRRTMEKYSPNLRLILLANSTSNIIAPIRSRTLLVRVAAPSEADITAVLRGAAERENWVVEESLNRRIASESGRNLRRALLMFEAIYAQNEKVSDKTPIPPPDWEALISVIADDILAERSPARILQVRERLYDLLTHCIPPTTILKTLTFKLITKVDDALKPEVIKWSAFYEHRIKLGSKVIFHLEAFVAKFMRIYEGYLMNMDF